jgi:AcrR family transcriptional regulator
MIKPEKRDEIIGAALELIAEHGFHGAPMAMIAEKAGVAAGTIYRYFENKDVLIREIYVCLEGEILGAIKEHYPEGRPIPERFMHIGKGLINYFLASPMKFRFIEQFHNSPYGVDCRKEKIFDKKDNDLIAELFEEGEKQQIIKDLPMPILCALTFGPLVDACRDHILQFIELDEPLITRIVSACWDAVKR